MQQPPNWQQPNTYYPPQQQPFQPEVLPPPPPVQQPPKKKSRKKLWLIIAAVVLVMAMCGGIMSALGIGGSTSQNTQTATSVATQASTPQPTNTPAPTAKPTQPPKWTTVQSFSGNGNKKTAIFNVPDDWKIVWSCYGFTDGSGVDGALTVSVYNSDGTPADPGAVNATCKAGSKPTSDNTEEHQSGDVYLDVGATGSWTIQVQALK